MPQPKKPGSSARKAAASKGARKGKASGGRASSRKPPPAPTSPEPEQQEDALREAVTAVRELLSRGVMITAERLQETMDEAVRRGRMTRTDAEELAQVLIQIGRRQTQDALAEIEGLVERSASETRKHATSRIRGVADAARRAPGADRALRTVDRARRAAGLGSSFPIVGYDDLTAARVKERLAGLSAPELRKVRDYERRNANRKSVLGAIEKRLG